MVCESKETNVQRILMWWEKTLAKNVVRTTFFSYFIQ